jgi:FkbM family methyltransferase
MSNNQQTINQSKPLVVYGLGAAGQGIVEHLISLGINIAYIIDKNKYGKDYKNIPIVSLAQAEQYVNNNNNCLIALNNHYIDLREIYQSLHACQFKQIFTLQQIQQIVKDIEITDGYWLDLDFNYDAHTNEIDAFKALLADSKSLAIANQIIRFRTLGQIQDYPAPSLDDEYAPFDIPRYKNPLAIIDCGAYDGIAIEKLIHAGYEVYRFAAFEPDQQNFAKLINKPFNVSESICLPLGVWSSNTQLRFSSHANMGSSLSHHGDSIIQCVRVDDVLHNFAPNLIKFDVEGAEIEAIHGLEKTIRRYQPNLAISVYHKPSHLFEIALLINAWNLGYSFYLRVHEHNTFGTVLYCLQDKHIQKETTS